MRGGCAWACACVCMYMCTRVHGGWCVCMGSIVIKEEKLLFAAAWSRSGVGG